MSGKANRGLAGPGDGPGREDQINRRADVLKYESQEKGALPPKQQSKWVNPYNRAYSNSPSPVNQLVFFGEMSIQTPQKGRSLMTKQKGINVTVHNFMGSVTPESVNKMVHNVEQAMVTTNGCAYIRMSSPGGEVASAVAAYNCLRAYGDRIVTHNVSNVDSSSMMIFLIGDHRIASPDAGFMAHPVGQGNNLQAISSRRSREMAEGMEFDESRICRIVASRTKFREQEYRTMMQTGKMMPAPFARRKGIVHEILPPDRSPMDHVAGIFHTKLPVRRTPDSKAIVDSLFLCAPSLVRVLDWTLG